jgi:hypothetical protein
VVPAYLVRVAYVPKFETVLARFGVVPEKGEKTNSWMRIDGTDFLSLKIQLDQEEEGKKHVQT